MNNYSLILFNNKKLKKMIYRLIENKFLKLYIRKKIK